MVLMDDVVWVILTQLKKCLLTYFQELRFDHVWVVVLLGMPAERIAEYEGDQDQVEKGEGVQCKVWEQCQSYHLQECLLTRLYVSAEQACTQWGKRVHLVYCLVILYWWHIDVCWKCVLSSFDGILVRIFWKELGVSKQQSLKQQSLNQQSLIKVKIRIDLQIYNFSLKPNLYQPKENKSMSNLRLGVSKDILPYTTQQFLDADRKFNKFIINTAQSGFKGLAFGVVASLFFARKNRIIFYSAGFGAGINFFSTICNEWGL